MIKISDSVIGRNILATIDIESKVKNLTALFDFIKQEFLQKNYVIEEINEYTLHLTSRKFIKREIISIQDYVESNSMSIEIASDIVLIPELFRNWLDKRSLRLKNSVWLILFLVMAILIPVIVIGYVQERFLMLRVFGIVLTCSAGLFYILNIALNPLITKRRLNQKNKAIELVDRIKQVISNYTEKELSGTICWNCFSGIKENEKICPNCEVSLKMGKP
ncbi:MAG: hypothetical protein H7645_01545 [Candidatus Heimdallarchaeota archaeon]|nr:hypothetical protein [Candidatus Heimdallarchaeota archaeon]MCK4769000.1 hypothetical protein [Candidatus Heimdallarchaeota archaeon]